MLQILWTLESVAVMDKHIVETSRARVVAANLLSSECLTLLRRPVHTRLITEEKGCAACRQRA